MARRNQKKIVFEVFSDGAVYNNGYKKKDLPQHSACGMVATYKEKVIWKGCKGCPDESISFAELTAAVTVLEQTVKLIENLKTEVPKPYNIYLYSDSQYVINGVNKWMRGWISRGWKNNVGKPVAQLEIWQYLKKEFLDNDDYNLRFIHIKGHTDEDNFHARMNDMCDTLAVEKLKRLREKLGCL